MQNTSASRSPQIPGRKRKIILHKTSLCFIYSNIGQTFEGVFVMAFKCRCIVISKRLAERPRDPGLLLRYFSLVIERQKNILKPGRSQNNSPWSSVHGHCLHCTRLPCFSVALIVGVFIFLI